jgi:hypothetical protein
MVGSAMVQRISCNASATGPDPLTENSRGREPPEPERDSEPSLAPRHSSLTILREGSGPGVRGKDQVFIVVLLLVIVIVI